MEAWLRSNTFSGWTGLSLSIRVSMWLRLIADRTCKSGQRSDTLSLSPSLFLSLSLYIAASLRPTSQGSRERLACWVGELFRRSLSQQIWWSCTLCAFAWLCQHCQVFPLGGPCDFLPKSSGEAFLGVSNRHPSFTKPDKHNRQPLSQLRGGDRVLTNGS